MIALKEHPLRPDAAGLDKLPTGKRCASAAEPRLVSRAPPFRPSSTFLQTVLGACLGAVSCLALAAPSVEAASWSDAKSTEAHALVERFLKTVDSTDPDLPAAALSLAIGSRGALYMARGYGEAAPGVPATAHTVYHVGSIAKQFTAAAVLDLIARHARLRNGQQLDLDLPLNEIFDGVEHWAGLGKGRKKHPVTLRNLLTMTSNLPNFTRRPPPETNPWGRIGAPELLSEVKKMQPWGWPNTFEYSNTSYFLLSEVMEEAIPPGARRPSAYRAYLQDVVFPRAKLVETGFIGAYPDGANVALPVGRRLPVFDQPNWLKGSADLASSAADLFAWNKAFMEGRVLPPEYAALMISGAGRVSPEIYYGMGWFVEYKQKQELFSHAGMVPGFTSMNMIAAETTGDRGWTAVTLLLNTDVAADGLEFLAKELIRLADR